MDRSHVRIAQNKLKEFGDYTGKIDGLRGPKTHAAVAKGMSKLGQGVPDGFSDWSGKRQTVAFLQTYAKAEGIESGAIDGWWGPQTNFAVDALEEKLTTGAISSPHDSGPGDVTNPHGFPNETRSQREIVAFYGKAGTKNGSHRPPMVKVPVPWKLKLSWPPHSTRSFLWAHEKCSDSLHRVLARIDAAYSDAQKTDLGIDLFGGDYNPRAMRGTNPPRSSLHSWGIAYDFDPARNQLKWNSSRARLGQRDAIPFWEAWESEGWCSLGRMKNFDFMHVQAAHRV